MRKAPKQSISGALDSTVLILNSKHSGRLLFQKGARFVREIQKSSIMWRCGRHSVYFFCPKTQTESNVLEGTRDCKLSGKWHAECLRGSDQDDSEQLSWNPLSKLRVASLQPRTCRRILWVQWETALPLFSQPLPSSSCRFQQHNS